MPLTIRPFLELSLIYVLGFISLIALLLLSSGPASAEWVKLSSDDRVTSYTDATTIRRSGNLVRMWDLVNFQTLQTSRNPYFSIKAVREYDCPPRAKPHHWPVCVLRSDGNWQDGGFRLRRRR